MMQDGDDCASLSDDRKGVAMIHEDICFVCGGNQMPLVFCSFCPKSYHEGCLPKGTLITSPRWGCPAHKCATCNATTSSSRGRLFRCKSCPTGFCKHHVPEGSTILKHNPLSLYGYKCSSYTWLLCKSCKDRGVLEEDVDHATADSEHATAVARSLPVLRSTPEPSIIHSIKKAIRKYSLSQKDIASQVEISQTRLSQFLNGAERSNGWKAVEQKLLNWLNSAAHANNDSPHDDTVSHSSGEEGASDTACGDEEEFVRPQKRRRLSYEPKQHMTAPGLVCPTPVQPVHPVNIKLPVPQVSVLEQARMFGSARPTVATPRSFIKQESVMGSYPTALFPVYHQPMPQFVALSVPHVSCSTDDYYMSAFVPSAPSPVPSYQSFPSEYAGDIHYPLADIPSSSLESFDYFPQSEVYNGVPYPSGSIDIFGM